MLSVIFSWQLYMSQMFYYTFFASYITFSEEKYLFLHWKAISFSLLF